MILRSVLTFLVATILIALSVAPSEAAAFRLNKLTMPDGSKQVARWDPCAPITVRVSVRGISDTKKRASATRITRATVQEVAAATGMKLVFEGRTRLVPRRGNLGKQPADVVVGFVRPGQTDYPLAGRAAGYGGWRATYRSSDGVTYPAIVAGFVVVDQTQTRQWSDGLNRKGVTRPNLLRHELGHAMGLEHINDTSQLMNHYLHANSTAGFANGDRAGLARVGIRAGCFPS